MGHNTGFLRMARPNSGRRRRSIWDENLEPRVRALRLSLPHNLLVNSGGGRVLPLPSICRIRWLYSSLGESDRNRLLRLFVFGNHLRLMLIQVQRRTELCLLRQQVFEPRFMLERPPQLHPVVGQRLLLPLDFLLFILGLTIKPTEDMFDAGDGSLRAVGIEVSPIRLLAPDEQVRRSVRKLASSAQDTL